MSQGLEKLKEYKRRVWTTYFHTVFGVILPFLIALLLLTIISKFRLIIHFLDRGDFCIYSVALFSTSIFLYKENESSIKEKIDRIFSNTLNYLLLFSAIIYGSIYLLQNLEFTINLVIDIWFVRCFSGALFAISLLAAYRAILLQHKDIYPGDISADKDRQETINNIMKDL